MGAPPVKEGSVFEELDGIMPPPKLVISAVEGWGKTTLGANVKGTVMLMASTESGYKTLLGAKKVPSVPCKITSKWQDTLMALVDIGDAKAITLDEASGFEMQCWEYVCKNEFKGNWKSFDAYKAGSTRASIEWQKLLNALEECNVPIIFLSHCAIKNHRDPAGEDFNRYVADLYKTTWSSTKRWADACLFGTFESIVSEGKGIGGTNRILFTEHRDAYDAKNRYTMPEEIRMGNDPDNMWNIIKEAIYGD